MLNAVFILSDFTTLRKMSPAFIRNSRNIYGVLSKLSEIRINFGEFRINSFTFLSVQNYVLEVQRCYVFWNRTARGAHDEFLAVIVFSDTINFKASDESGTARPYLQFYSCWKPTERHWDKWQFTHSCVRIYITIYPIVLWSTNCWGII